MNSQAYYTLFTIVVLTLLGCTTQNVTLDKAIIHNATPGVITDVNVLHEPTGKTGGVNIILPGRSLNIGFSGQPMLAKQAIITWRDSSGKKRRSEVSLPYDQKASWEQRPISLVYVIQPSGNVTTRFER